jgi:hypothetical protein
MNGYEFGAVIVIAIVIIACVGMYFEYKENKQ